VVLIASSTQFGYSGHADGLVESQKLSSVQDLVSHKHEEPVVPVFTVTPSLFVQVCVASAHVPCPGIAPTLQIWWGVHVAPPSQMHSTRFAVSVLQFGVGSTHDPLVSHFMPTAHVLVVTPLQ
jgi:hypothetical protein